MQDIKKRGQLSVFILLGIVILIIFMFLFKTSVDIENEKLRTKAEQTLSQKGNEETVSYYLDLCLRQAAENALLTIGSQGGRIYDYQNGSSKINETYHMKVNISEEMNVSYGIFSPKLFPPFNDSFPPSVPYYPETSRDFFYINTSKYYYLGQKLLPMLCDAEGPNRYNISKNLTGASCWLRKDAWYWDTKPDNFQIQLEEYTSFLFEQCVNKSYIKNSMSYELSLGSPNTTVILGEDDVTFLSEFPVNITYGTALLNLPKTFTKQVFFKAKYPVRVKRIFDFFMETNDMDTKSVIFDFDKNYGAAQSYEWLKKASEEVQVTKSRLEPRHDDIITLTDFNSVLKGMPYSFSILVKNRFPILDWLHELPLGSPIDIEVLEGKEIRIEPIGYDPDEDYYNASVHNGNRIMEHNYSYEGWMETYYYYFNYTCCVNDCNSNLDDCLKEVSDGGCVTRNDTNKPHVWTDSTSYSLTSRIAAYNTSISDFGTHWLLVKVCDHEGLCDWQNVTIHVIDVPVAVAEGQNLFPDIPDQFASIEDPYILNASESRSPLGASPSWFKWEDDVEPFVKETFEEVMYVPWFDLLDVTVPDSIDNMADSSPNPVYFQKDNPQTHQITLTLMSYPQATDKIDVEVFKCLPHQDLIYNAAPYPFNYGYGYKDEGFNNFGNNPNPYMANHACCDGEISDPSTWNYKLDSTVCYDFKSYGGFWSFDDDRFTGITTSNMDLSNYDVTWTYAVALSYQLGTEDIGGYPSIFSSPYNYDASNKYYSNNDVYQREFKTFCSGNRGNICDHDPTEIRYMNINIGYGEACSDKLNDSQDEKCSGPHESYFGMNTESADNKGCINYDPGESFDKLLDEAGIIGIDITDDKADGQCQENYQCTDCQGKNCYDPKNDYGNNYDGSNYLTKGLCDGEGGCTYGYGVDNGINIDLNLNPGTNYNFGDDTTIDCRCWARKCDGLSGSGGYDLNDCQNDNDDIIEDQTEFSLNDNEADVYNLIYDHPLEPNTLGKCVNGQIYTCNVSYGINEDGCENDTTTSGKIIENKFFNGDTELSSYPTPFTSGNIALRKYLSKNNDSVCGTNEICGDEAGSEGTDYEYIDPDTNETVCKLLRAWKIDSNTLSTTSTSYPSPNPFYYTERSYDSIIPSSRQCCMDDANEREDKTDCDGIGCDNNDLRKGCRIPSECVYSENGLDYIAYQSNINNPNSYLDVDGDNDKDYCYYDSGDAVWRDCSGVKVSYEIVGANSWTADGFCPSNQWCVTGDDSGTKGNCQNDLSGYGVACTRDSMCAKGYCVRDFFGGYKCTDNNHCLFNGAPVPSNQWQCDNSLNGRKLCSGNTWFSFNGCGSHFVAYGCASDCAHLSYCGGYSAENGCSSGSTCNNIPSQSQNQCYNPPPP